MVESAPNTKQRTATPEELEKLVDKFLDDCKDLRDGDEVNAKAVGKKYNISLSLVDDIILAAFQRNLPRIKVVKHKVSQARKSDNPYINSRMSIMIGKTTIEALNGSLEGGLKFKENDQFTVELQDRNIVLKPTS